jgi:HAMP domain-containing protein
LAIHLSFLSNLAQKLTSQVRSIATVTSAIAAGDLNHKIEVEVMGEMAELKQTVNGQLISQKRGLGSKDRSSVSNLPSFFFYFSSRNG